MGKAKKGGGGKGVAAATAKKCTCTDPYKCSCGNRPERPSKGHKWDPETQAWGGKGHKQKGASGQTATADKQATTTAVGKTTLASWQRLPSQLLTEYAQRQKKYKRPKYKALQDGKGGGANGSGNLYKYRIILPDLKGDDKKDLFFIPPKAVANEEQAKEEAALLALLHITPDIPHERTLPEPYKTTWLNALAFQKGQKATGTTAASASSAATAMAPTGGSPKPQQQPAAPKQPPPSQQQGVAQASDNLMQGARVTSQAQKEQADLERRQRIRQRTQRQDAMRMANRNQRVTMTANVRRKLEQVLLGNKVDVDWDDEEEEEETTTTTLLEPDSDMQAYVEDRLHEEGFTKVQARKAFQNTLQRQSAAELPEDEWDTVVYEQCLQWLLLHVAENDLPAGYDTQEGHLEVVANLSDIDESKAVLAKRLNATITAEGKAFAQRFGIAPSEAAWVLEQSSEDKSVEATFWDLLCQLQRSGSESKNVPSTMTEPSEDCQMQLEEEVEALQAIFDNTCSVENNDAHGLSTIAIEITTEDDDKKFTLEIVVQRGFYPMIPPQQVLVSSSGAWPTSPHYLGTPLHCQIAEFLATNLTLEQPAVFEIHGHVSDLLANLGDLSPTPPSLLDLATSKQPTADDSKPSAKVPSSSKPTPNGNAASKQQTSRRHHRSKRRPREKSPFWSVPPAQTPAATSFPKISASLQKARASLPAAAAKKEFLNLLRQSQSGGRVVLLTGETGCGKSTQIPQFILEEFPTEAKIVVCQPRRVAATGVATRVAEERGEAKPGIESVGYVVRGDSAICNKSRLVFCTTGVLLRQMQSENAFESLTHLVLDEVHERSLDMDVLLALLKERLPQHPHLSVILMSATLNAQKFASYWGRNTPSIHIPGRTFPVKDYFLEDVLVFTEYMPPKPKGGKKASKSESGTASDTREVNGVPVNDLVDRIDSSMVDYKLVAALVKHIITAKEAGDDGSILVFLPGAPEINRALDMVAKEMRGMSLVLLPLHGGLQPRDQNLVFNPAGVGKHKVIFSTNIAETSVTIPDCTAVIDCAREKQSSYDPSNRMPLLIETFCSKASLKQRRGRAGRVRPGTCFKLISNRTFTQLKEETDPEILRTALDQTLLSLLFLGIDCSASGSFMKNLLDRPDADSVQSALESLEALGAVENTKDQLTPLGMHLAGIPAPPVVGKILILACILGCRDAGLAMGAGLSVGRSPLLRIEQDRKRGAEVDPVEEIRRQTILNERKKMFEEVGKSDHAFLVKLFMSWESNKGGGGRKKFCDDLGLSFPGMLEILQLKQQFDSALTALGYYDSVESNRHSNLWRIIRAVAVAGMAPSQLVKIVRPAQTYQETAEGAKEKEARAQALKLFVRTSRATTSSPNARENEERVFIHPSSGNFAVGNYSCPWLVYNSLVRTSKPFLRDVTECNVYSLLLFGGELEIQASQGVIVIDNWCQLSAGAKIGTLMGGLRRRLDELLTAKVEDPSFNIANTPEMAMISRLIRKDGW